MGKEVIFKTFRTYAHPYMYDRHTNSLVMLTDDEFKELREVETGNLPWEQSAVVQKYQSFGLMQPNVVEKIEHSGTEIVEHYLNTRMRQLILQVTQQCNLRCAYCTYSGIYTRNRTHSNKRMTIETAKRAIDFFLQHNSDLSEVVIGFYGGEPLLEFDLIRQCVEYAKSRVEGKKIRFNITTNGTLLSDSVVDFLVDNSFQLSVSLDGSKEEHDANRRFVNGKGSFDTIIKNIERIRERYPEYDKKISILTTINPHSDLGCVLEYFSTEDVFTDKNIVFNSMKEVALNQELNYDNNFYSIRNFEYIKMLMAMVGKIDKKCLSPLVNGTMGSIANFYNKMHNRSPIMSIIHHGGPCVAGVQRLFVRYDGEFFPCERVSDNLDYFNIGSLDAGLKHERIQRLLNIGKITENECKNCWCLRNCTICSEQIEFEKEPTKTDKLKSCAKSRNAVLFDLYQLCVLCEFGYDPNKKGALK